MIPTDASELVSKPQVPDPGSISWMTSSLRDSTSSPTLIDLGILSGDIDATGLWAALTLALRVVLSAAVALAAGRVFRWLVSSRKHHRQNLGGRWLRAIVIGEIVVFAIGSLLAIRWWIQEASSVGLVAGMLAVVGIVVAFRRAIDNAIAGIMFSIRGSIRHGDSIEVDKVRGTVQQIALTHTQLHGSDGSMYWIPNRMLNQSILRIGKIKNVAIITVALPEGLGGHTYESLRLRAYLCPYRRANSPVRITDKDRGQPKLELQTWAMRDGTRAIAHVEQWVDKNLAALRPMGSFAPNSSKEHP